MFKLHTKSWARFGRELRVFFFLNSSLLACEINTKVFNFRDGKYIFKNYEQQKHRICYGPLATNGGFNTHTKYTYFNVGLYL